MKICSWFFWQTTHKQSWNSELEIALDFLCWVFCAGLKYESLILKIALVFLRFGIAHFSNTGFNFLEKSAE